MVCGCQLMDGMIHNELMGVARVVLMHVRLGR